MLSAPTSLPSVLLQVLSHCLQDPFRMQPQLRVMVPPVWLLSQDELWRRCQQTNKWHWGGRPREWVHCPWFWKGRPWDLRAYANCPDWVLWLCTQCGNCELDVGASSFAKEEGICGKGVKDFSVLWRQLGRRASGVEVHRSGSRDGITGVKLEWEIFEHRLNIVSHMDADLSAMAKVKGHAKVIIELATSLFDFSTVTTHGVKPFCELIIDCGGNILYNNPVTLFWC